MGSDGSRFNVLLIVQEQIRETVSINHYFLKTHVSRSGESNLGLSAFQPSALPPGQAGSLRLCQMMCAQVYFDTLPSEVKDFGDVYTSYLDRLLCQVCVCGC